MKSITIRKLTMSNGKNKLILGRVRKFTYLSDRVSVGGGCETAVTVRTRHGAVKLRESSELLYGMRTTEK